MMQNGFRRIALAQGLLPERPPSREAPANVEPSTAQRLDVTEEAGAWDGDPDMRVASST
jgi:hypothetical protein